MQLLASYILYYYVSESVFTRTEYKKKLLENHYSTLLAQDIEVFLSASVWHPYLFGYNGMSKLINILLSLKRHWDEAARNIFEPYFAFSDHVLL